MQKTVKVKLSTKDINETIEKLKSIQSILDNAEEKVIDELCDLGLKELEDNYTNTFFKDGNDDYYFFKKGTRKNRVIGVMGSQVLYDEFGTGTEGASSPHPIKGNFDLNDYNSGSTIRQNKTESSNASSNGIPVGGLYWTYKVDGQKVYTQGIPAGKQVYTTIQKLKKEKKKIMKKVVGDALSKL